MDAAQLHQIRDWVWGSRGLTDKDRDTLLSAFRALRDEQRQTNRLLQWVVTGLVLIFLALAI